MTPTTWASASGRRCRRRRFERMDAPRDCTRVGGHFDAFAPEVTPSTRTTPCDRKTLDKDGFEALAYALGCFPALM